MAARDDYSVPGVRSSEVIVIVQPPDSGQGVQLEGRVLRVDRDALLVDWGGRLGTVRHSWSEVGDRFARVPRRAAGARSDGHDRRVRELRSKFDTG
jgi:hypothetical protein